MGIDGAMDKGKDMAKDQVDKAADKAQEQIDKLGK